MKSCFSENIKKLRKQRHLTQEQFAEAMGVTVGAIYKWEQGLSLPDIGGIMEIAGFFGISVDALIGYELQDSTVEAYAQRIYDLQQKKAYEQAAAQAEKALVLYPNHFQIVYRSMRCLPSVLMVASFPRSHRHRISIVSQTKESCSITFIVRTLFPARPELVS